MKKMNLNLKLGAAPRLTLGGVPRVDLLPPEVGLSAKARAMHRGLIVVVVAVMVVVGAGYGVASFQAGQSQHQLDAANARALSLVQQQAKYSEVGKVTAESNVVAAAQQVGASTEINWKSYLELVQASLPAGTTIVTFTATSGSPLAEFAQSTVPLEGARVAELTFSARSPSLPDVQAWLNSLAKLTGFVDASPGSVALSPDGSYLAGVTMHINQKALANRFAGTGD